MVDPARIRTALAGLWLACVATTTPAQAPMAPPLGPHDASLARCFQHAIGGPDVALATADELLAAPGLPAAVTLRAHVCRSLALSTRGDAAAAEAEVDTVLALLEAPGLAPAERPPALATTASVLGAIGQWQRAAELHERAYAEAREQKNMPGQIAALLAIAQIQNSFLDDPALADTTLREAIALAVSIGHEHPMLYYNLGYNLMLLGRNDEALPALDRALALAQQPGPPGAMESMRARIDTHRGVILHARGDASGRALIENALVQQGRLRDAQGEAVTRTHLGRIQRESGDLEAALANVEAALKLAETGRFVREQQQALHELAAIQTALGNADTALELTRREHALETGQLRSQNLKSLAGLQSQLSQDVDHAAIDRATRVRNLALGTLLIVVAFALGIAWHQVRVNRRLRETGMTDPLTGLLNRREASRRLDADLLPTVVGPGRRAGVLMRIDLDDFRRIVETHGHATGDRALQAVAARLRALCAPDDLLARWDDGDFVVAAASRTRDEAQALAERLRAGIASTPSTLADGSTLPLSVSIGVVPYPFHPQHDDASWTDVLRLADRAADLARERGGNAWVAIWGTTAGIGTPLDTVLQDMDRAQATGWIDVVTGGTAPAAHGPGTA